MRNAIPYKQVTFFFNIRICPVGWGPGVCATLSVGASPPDCGGCWRTAEAVASVCLTKKKRGDKRDSRTLAFWGQEA